MMQTFHDSIGSSVVCQRPDSSTIDLPPQGLANNVLTSWYATPVAGDWVTLYVSSDLDPSKDSWRLLKVVKDTFFGPMRVSVMLDSNGSNTTAVAAVVKLQQAGEVKNRRALVTAATGPVGMRAAGLLAQAGAHVTVTSRRAEGGAKLAADIKQRFGATVTPVAMADASQAAGVMQGCEFLLSAGGFGVKLVPREAWAKRPGLLAAADVNAVPPLGVEGIDAMDNGVDRDGIKTYGALGIGGLKMKLHKACIAKLFERNDLVLDAESILEVARTL